MIPSRERNRLTRPACLALGATLFGWANAALASQGPGVAAGTASSLTQTMMAILIYGASVLVVATGLIRALGRQ
jgi:hypothetical protein